MMSSNLEEIGTMSYPTATESRADARLWDRISLFHKVKLMFFLAGFSALVLSVSLWFFVDEAAGLFVGLWVPAIHSLGALALVGEDRSR
jgi:hypothetical protein